MSQRQGRALQGYDEVYSDPNVQEALQKGDDGEARNIIKDRLCYLGLMQVGISFIQSNCNDFCNEHSKQKLQLQIGVIRLAITLCICKISLSQHMTSCYLQTIMTYLINNFYLDSAMKRSKVNVPTSLLKN